MANPTCLRCFHEELNQHLPPGVRISLESARVIAGDNGIMLGGRCERHASGRARAEILTAGNLEELDRIMKRPGPTMSLNEAMRIGIDIGLFRAGIKDELPQAAVDDI